MNKISGNKYEVEDSGVASRESKEIMASFLKRNPELENQILNEKTISLEKFAEVIITMYRARNCIAVRK